MNFSPFKIFERQKIILFAKGYAGQTKIKPIPNELESFISSDVSCSKIQMSIFQGKLYAKARSFKKIRESLETVNLAMNKKYAT